MPRTATALTPAGERILQAAGDLFYTHGIRAVGVETIAETAGVTKKTLYDRFGSNDALVAMYLQRRSDRWRDFVTAHLEQRAALPATERILAVFDALDEWSRASSRGCAFVNAFAEIGGTGHPGVDIIRDEKAWTLALYQGLLEEAGAEAEHAARLGLRLTVLHEGALVMVTAGDQPDAIAHARATAESMLAEALPAAGSRT